MIFRLLLFSCLVVLLLSLLNVDGQQDEFKKVFPNIKEIAIPNFEISDPTQLQKETFALLKEKFPGERLDKKFTTLRKLSKSEDYLTYLGHAFPDIPRFKTFEAFMEKVLPAKERYFPFFEASLHFKEVEDITQADLIAVHILANSFWKTGARDLHSEDFQDPLVFLKPEVYSWLEKNDMAILNPPEGFGSFQKVLEKILSLRIVVGANQKADAALVKKFFQRDNENKGILWLAIQEPLLFGRILDGFTDIEIFRKWTEEDFYKKTDKRKKP